VPMKLDSRDLAPGTGPVGPTPTATPGPIDTDRVQTIAKINM
jgi:hypothetical protein